jgi:hypothetical protein
MGATMQTKTFSTVNLNDTVWVYGQRCTVTGVQRNGVADTVTLSLTAGPHRFAVTKSITKKIQAV